MLPIFESIHLFRDVYRGGGDIGAKPTPGLVKSKIIRGFQTHTSTEPPPPGQITVYGPVSIHLFIHLSIYLFYISPIYRYTFSSNIYQSINIVLFFKKTIS